MDFDETFSAASRYLIYMDREIIPGLGVEAMRQYTIKLISLCFLALGFTACNAGSNTTALIELPQLKDQASTEFTAYMNQCRQDVTAKLSLKRDLNTMTITGGFNYLSAKPNVAEGFINDDGTIQFFFEEGETLISCTAVLDKNDMVGSCAEGEHVCHFHFQIKK